MESVGRPPVTIDLSMPGSEATLKDKPFRIKEGAKFTMVATFKVQHEVLSGLQYVHVVKRKGIRVSKESEMIVSALTLNIWRCCREGEERGTLTSACREATRQTRTSSRSTLRNVSPLKST